jgi:hypothetical protein
MNPTAKNIGIIVLIAAIAAVAALGIFRPELLKSVFSGKSAEDTRAAYQNQTLGVTFKYPTSYQLQERDIEINKAPVHFITLAQTTDVPQGGEGPTAMSVTVFTLDKPVPLADWLHSMQNLTPAPTGGYDYQETTVAGEPALAYSATGLYESDNVAVARGNRVYVFSVTWLTRQDPILKDFDNLLKTVSFGF